ncbi:MAG: amino acid adenylation domain-containing protein [Pseudonocardiales bacterium]
MPAVEWWGKQLAGAPALLELPTDRPRLSVAAQPRARVRAGLDPATAQGLRDLADAERATPDTAHLGILALVLSRWATAEEVVIGGRDGLPVRIDLSGDPTVREVIARARDASLGAANYQDVTYELLVEHLGLGAEVLAHPIYQVAMTCEPLSTETVDMDVVLAVTTEESQTELTWDYSADLYDEATVSDLAASFAAVAMAAVARPDAIAATLPLLDSAGQAAVIASGRGPRLDQITATVIDQVLTTARRDPDRIAVTGDDATWTYAQLVRRGAWVADELRARGVGPTDLVGVCAQRSAAMIAALLGVLEVGAAYVPLDPHFPADRLAYMLEDSQARVLISVQLQDGQEPTFAGEVLRFDVPGESEPRETGDATLQDLAYVIYTSGSTGKPKGVMIEHLALANFIRSMAAEPGLRRDDVLIAVTTLSFDIAGLEIWLPLTRGAKTVVVSARDSADPGALAEIIEREDATAMQATPATWRLLLDNGWQGRQGLRVLCGGEALPTVLAGQLRACVGELWNMYGPTETTIWSTVHRVTDDGSVPLGHPIDETDLVVADRSLVPVPAGVAGELLIGGLGLARGYLGRPELTAEKFTPTPFGNELFYRTGDLVRRRRDGRLEYIGRMDNQVKLRGFRIELGEIETVLERHDLVRAAAVLVKASSTGEQQLVAYINWAGKAVSAAEIRSYAGEWLPPYMVPSILVTLDAFPRTPNGKLDRKALPEPTDWSVASTREYVAPRTETERRLALLWQEMLRRPQVGVTDDFFDLGVDSLTAARIFTQTEKQFGRLPLGALFSAPTIEKVAAIIDGGKRERDRFTSLVPVQTGGTGRPFFGVHGGAGTILLYAELAKRLAPSRPFYALQAVGLYGRQAPQVSVDAMAKHYITEMRQVQPHGPYLLGGYCFGALVAFEIGKQLRAAGEEIDLLATFNGPAPTYNDSHIPVFDEQGALFGPNGEPLRPEAIKKVVVRADAKTKLQRIVGNGNPVTVAKGAGAAAYRVVRRKTLPRYRNLQLAYCTRFNRPLPEELRENWWFQYLAKRAQDAYKPGPGDFPVAVFRAEGLYYWDDLGWRVLTTGPVHCIEVPGIQRIPRDSMKEPFVAHIAAWLDDYASAAATT